MWITRAKWEWLKGQVEWLKPQLIASDRRFVEAANRAESLERQLTDVRSFNADAVAQRAAAQVRASLLQIENNALKLERAAFLTRLLPGLTLQVPQVGRDRAVVAPLGSDFEDMGDEAAAAGYPSADLIPLPDAEETIRMLQDVIGAEEPEGEAPGTALGGRQPPATGS